ISSDEIDLYRAKFGKQVMIGIGADRFAVGELLERDGINCFVLDDGFQHFRLARDLNIVLVDSTTSLSSALLLPAGSFREPLTALSRADLVILTRTDSGNAPQLSAKIKAYTKAPIFLASTELLEIYQATPNKLTKQAGVTVGKEIHSSQFLLQRMTCNNTKVFAFCAIGNPEAFYSDLKRWGLEVVGKAAYRDHHQYSRKDLETLRRNAESSGAEVLICTEKDILNLNLSSSLGVFGKMPLLTASIGMRLEKPEQFWEMFHRLIASPTSGGPQ
ncbi:MAG: tetraacyldisaccharide 4'-kinase, partial [Acidobacteria bacterium]|nr:tetraacyldisaccharide 4'-kinase [Acidobacteriota bacterium]